MLDGIHFPLYEHIIVLLFAASNPFISFPPLSTDISGPLVVLERLYLLIASNTVLYNLITPYNVP